MLKLSVLLIFSVSKVLGNCGQPAAHPELWTSNSIGVAEEGHEQRFQCRDDLSKKNDGFVMAYWNVRVCTKGKWNRRMPKCGELIFF